MAKEHVECNTGFAPTSSIKQSPCQPYIHTYKFMSLLGGHIDF